MTMYTAVANTEDWRQVGELATAFVLSAAIGLEREIRQKSAGLRTHTLVGVGAALFMLVSKYGFSDVVRNGTIVADPSRVAAQIVSGIGFLGAGIIFVRSDAVRGLTTAAAIWLTAAVGSAAGAGLPVLAAATTVTYFVVVIALTPISRRLPASATAESVIRVRYQDGQGVLRQVLARTTSRGFQVAELATRSQPLELDGGLGSVSSRLSLVEVTLRVHGKGSVNDLATGLTELEGVEAVIAGDVNQAGE